MGIRVRNNKIHRTKNNKGRTIRLGNELLKKLEVYRRFPSDWVISSLRAPKQGRSPKKRGISTSRFLSKWLRVKLMELGLRNPTHWLRKVFGSVVAMEHSMLVASKYLGHSSIDVTEKVYVGLVGGGPTVRVI